MEKNSKFVIFDSLSQFFFLRNFLFNLSIQNLYWYGSENEQFLVPFNSPIYWPIFLINIGKLKDIGNNKKFL